MPKTPGTIVWKSIQIPEELEKEILEYVKAGRFVSKNELARNAIRWYLDALKKGELP